MEQTQTTDSPTPTKKDRKLKVICKPTLIWLDTDPNHLNIQATAEFTQDDGVGITDPPMAGVVSPLGKIDISKMPKDNKYSDNIDVTFLLDTSLMKNADGTALTGGARWACTDEGDYPLPGGGSIKVGFGWFCNPNPNAPSGYDPVPPITIPNMTFSRKNDNVLEIDDNTTVGTPQYGYCIAFVLPGYGNYYISIDPLLTTKGTRQSFMLEE